MNILNAIIGFFRRKAATQDVTHLVAQGKAGTRQVVNTAKRVALTQQPKAPEPINLQALRGQRSWTKKIAVWLTVFSFLAPLAPVANATGAQNPNLVMTINAQGGNNFAVNVTGTVPGGPINIYDNGIMIGAMGVNAPSYTIILASGNHSIYATFPGDPLYAAQTTPAQVIAGGPSAYTTSLTLSTPVPAAGPTGTWVFTANVINGSAPMGRVGFYVDGVFSGNVDLSGGVATYTSPQMAYGPHQITAFYAGDPQNSSAWSSANNILLPFGTQNPNLLMNVTPQTGNNFGLVLTGMLAAGSVVSFFDNGIFLGTAATNNMGLAQTTVSLSSAQASSPIPHNIYATYAGDATYAPTQTAPQSEVGGMSSSYTTSLALSTPVPSGGPWVFTASITGGNNPTGKVAFMANGVVLGVAPVTAGVATLTPSNLQGGPQQITAFYQGDSVNSASSTSISGNFIVPLGPTTLNLSIPQAAPGGPLTTIALATLQGNMIGSIQPTGTVQLYDGVTLVSTQSTVGFGILPLPFTPVSGGTHNLSAKYTGDTNYGASTSSVVPYNVYTPSITVTPVSPGANPNWTFNVDVAGLSPGGTVTFKNGSTVIGSARLSVSSTLSAANHGTTSFVAPALAAGSNSITATFSGDGNNLPVTSSATAISAAATTTTLTAPTPAAGVNIVNMTATVSGNSQNGTVQFFDSGMLIGSKVLSAGAATLSYAAPWGANTFTAKYLGDANAAPSAVSNSVAMTLANATATTTTLTSTASTIPSNSPVTFTATVSGASPTGSITFYSDAVAIGTVTMSGGTASLTQGSQAFVVGSHTISAKYSGDGSNASSVANLGTALVVTIPTTTISLTPSASQYAGRTIAFQAIVTSPLATTGTVTFKDGTTILSTVTLIAASSGVANYTSPALSLGAHNITAVYSGDANNGGSTSAVSIQTVVAAPTAVYANANSNTAITAGASAALNAQVVTSGGYTPTGTVTFKDGATTLGTASIVTVDASSGNATLSVNTLAAGTHTITANYAGDANNAASSGTATQVVNQGASTTTIASSVNPSVYGGATTLTATVAGFSPTGTVTFKDGATTIGTSTLAAGVATLSVTSLSVGSHALTAVYAGDANNVGNNSSNLAQTVNLSPSTTTLSSSANPTTYSGSTTLTATVTGVAPSGTVTFKDGGTTLGYVSVNAGVASYTISSLAGGSHNLSAVYAGDSNNSASTSNTVAQTVKPIGTTTSVTSSVNPSTYGASTTFTATIANGISPTGTVTFKDGATTIGTGTVSGTTATLAIATLTGGTHSITAVYGGDTNNATSTSTALTQTVNTVAPTTALASSVNPTTYGSSTTFTATMTPSTATGTVTFKDGATTLGTASISAGIATYATAALSSGTHSITAVYSGDTNNAAGPSGALTQTVNLKATTTAVTSSVNPTTFGGSTSFTATINGAASPTGAVTFKDGATTIGTGTVSGTTATLAISTLLGGTHSITAVYSGDANNATSTSSALTQTVNLKATTTAVTSTVNPTTFGGSTSFTATIIGATSPTGTVTFKDGATNIGTVGISGNSATYTSAALVAGSHTITAAYSGDTNNTASTSTNLIQTVNTASTTTTLTSSANPSVYASGITLTANVSGGAATGTVTFKDGSTTVATSSLSSGVATATVSSLSVGSHNLTATYAGDGNDLASTSATLVQTVNQATTTISVAPSANPTALGAAVTFTATVSGGAAPSGNVIFSDGANSFAMVSLSAGVAPTTTTALTAGSHTITARYYGDVNNVGSTSPNLIQTVATGSSTTTLTSRVNPSVFGGQVALIVSVTGVGTWPTGTVTIKDGATTLATGTLTSGNYLFVTSSLAVGTHSLTAVYGGDTNYGNSTSAALTQTVLTDATSTTLSSSVNPTVFGGATTLTATVGGATNPTGTVTFKDGSTTLGTVALSGSQATLSVTSLVGGAHSLTAIYSGDANNSTGTSAALLQTVNLLGTTTTVASSANPVAIVAAPTFTATVSPSTATGTVTFKDGAVTLGTGTISAGVATFTPVATAAAVGTVVNPYQTGATAYAAFSNTGTGFAACPTTIVNLGGVNYRSGEGVACPFIGTKVVLYGAAPGTGPGTASGWLTKVATGGVTCGNGLAADPASGTVKVCYYKDNAAPLVGGTHSITAVYSGDTNNASSTSAALTQTVTAGAGATTTTLTSSVNPTIIGSSTTFTATVSPSIATGTVIFKDGTTVVGTGPIASGVATIATSALSGGTHSITAFYGGDTSNANSTSAALTQTVNLKPTTTALASSVNPTTFGGSTTLTATVTGDTSPTGTVTFKDGTTTVGSAQLSGTTATLAVTSLNAGARSITAVYSGDAVNATSTSAALTQTVNQASTTIAITSVFTSADVGNLVPVVATVQGSSFTGNVQLSLNGSVYATTAIAAGQNSVTFNVKITTAGTNNITALFQGDANHTASAVSNMLSLVTQTATTSVNLSSAAVGMRKLPAGQGTVKQALTSIVGSSVTLNVSIPSAVAVTGNVVFKDGAAVLGTVPVASKAASLTVSNFALGNHSITAIYSGDSLNASGVSAPLAFATINRLVVDSYSNFSNATLVVGDTAMLYPVVNGDAIGSNPTGTITIALDGTSVATGVLTSTGVTYTMADGYVSTAYAYAYMMNAGTHTVVTSYSGDVNNPPSSSTTTLVVNKAGLLFGPPTKSLLSASNGDTLNVQVTLPSGVSALLNASALAFHATVDGVPVALSSYSGACTSPNYGTGPHPTRTICQSYVLSFNANATTGSVIRKWVVTFDGDSNFYPATSQTFYGTRDANARYLSNTPDPSVCSMPCLIRTFLPLQSDNYGFILSTSANTSFGDVSYYAVYYDGVDVAHIPNANGAALTSWSYRWVPPASFNVPGTHEVFFVGFNSSGQGVAVSSALDYAVTPVANATLSPSSNINVLGTSATVFANVTPFVSGQTVQGQVQFSVDGSPIGVASINNGIASLAITPALSAGSHTITAASANSGMVINSTPLVINVGAATAVNMVWQYGYDQMSRPNNTLDPNGNQTYKYYDILGRVIQTQAPAPAGSSTPTVVDYQYDTADNLVVVADPRNIQTTYVPNGFGQNVSQMSPDTNQTAYTYDVNGNVRTKTDARGKVTTMTYDKANRLVSVSYPTGVGTTITYDGATAATAGLVTQVTDESGSSSYTYDTASRLTSKTTVINGKSFTVQYAWGTAGTSLDRLATITYPSGSKVNYAYDTRGLISGITVNPANPNGVGSSASSVVLLQNATANAAGMVTGWSWSDGTQVNFGIDGYGQLQSMPLGKPNGTGAAAGELRNLVRDAAGRITGMTHTTAGVSVPALDQSFVYDNLGQLTSATLAGATTQYTYDANGNRTSKIVGGSTYTNSISTTSNRQVQVQDVNGTFAVQYDTAGNVTNDGVNTYTYSDRGRMASVTTAGGTVTYLFNSIGQRAYKAGPTPVVPTGGAYYVYNEAGQLFGEYDATGAVVAETVYMNGTPVGVVKQTGTAAGNNLTTTLYNIYSDQINTARVITRQSDQGIAWRWDSAESYGGSAANQNPNGLGVFTYDNRMPGQVFDAETGLFQNWNREYNPRIGRYMQSDPIGLGGGLNTYEYASGAPTMLVDPQGTCDFFCSVGNAISDLGNSITDFVNHVGDVIATDPVAHTIATIAVVAYTGDVMTTFTDNLVVTGAASGFAGGLEGSNGNLDTALKGAVSGAVFGGINADYGNSWDLGRYATNAAAGGLSSAINGGNFAQGVEGSLVTGAAQWGYTSNVGYAAVAQSGWNVEPDANGLRDQAYRQLNNGQQPAWSIGMNVIGVNSTAAGNLCNQGSLCSRALNLVPGINATAGFHDWIFNSNPSLQFTTFNNVGTMLPAAAISYTAILNGPLSTQVRLH